jgi:hypothetical protein
MVITVQLLGEKARQEVSWYVLNELLARGRVAGFQRSGGWVVVGRDPVRQSAGYSYRGPERRRQRRSACLSCPHIVAGECANKDCAEWRNNAKVFAFGST